MRPSQARSSLAPVPPSDSVVWTTGAVLSPDGRLVEGVGDLPLLGEDRDPRDFEPKEILLAVDLLGESEGPAAELLEKRLDHGQCLHGRIRGPSVDLRELFRYMT